MALVGDAGLRDDADPAAHARPARCASDGGAWPACFAASCFIDIHLEPDSVGGDFTLSQLLRGVGQMLAMMPLNQASMAAVGREKAAMPPGIYNMARNLGGSVGLALCGVFIDRRSALHAATIRESVTANSLLGQARLARTASPRASTRRPRGCEQSRSSRA